FHQPHIEKRKSSLDGMSHSHPVPLRREKVLRKKNQDFQVLRTRQRRPVLESGGQHGGEMVKKPGFIVHGHIVIEESACSTVVAPTHGVRIPRGPDFIQSLAEKGR